MALSSGSSTQSPWTFEGDKNPLRIPIGAASPLWLLFAGAAASGAAYWWLRQLAKPVNLEAMIGAKAKAPEAAPAAEAPAEAAEAPVEAVGVMQTPVEAPEPLAPLAEAAVGAVEAIVEPPPAPEPPVVEAAPPAPEPVKSAAPKAAAKPRSARPPLPPSAES